jgi:hypothetical protein
MPDFPGPVMDLGSFLVHWAAIEEFFTRVKLVVSFGSKLFFPPQVLDIESLTLQTLNYLPKTSLPTP